MNRIRPRLNGKKSKLELKRIGRNKGTLMSQSQRNGKISERNHLILLRSNM